jgi:hypothetical protein
MRVIPYILYAAWLWIDWVCLQDDADDERRVPASPYIAREVGLSQFKERVLVVYG